MRLRLIAAVLACVVFGLYGLPAHADFLGSPADCAAALKQDVVTHASSEQQQYAYLNILDQHEFEEIKRGGSTSATFPIADALIKGSADYSDFQQRRSDLFQKVGYSASSAQSESDLSITTNPLAYAAYDHCMATYSRQQVGFYAWKVSENKDAVVINYFYQSPPGGGPVGLSGTLIHGVILGVPQGQIFPAGFTVLPNGGGTVTIQRQGAPGDTVTAALSADGYPGTSVESTYADAPAVVAGSADVEVLNATTSNVPGLDLSAVSGQTRNNDHVRCPGGPCSNDGKWRADRVELTIHAPPGSTLSGAAQSCSGGGCPFNGLDRLAIEGDGSAHLIVRTWSLPTVWTLTAHQTKTVSTATRQKVNHAVFHSGSIATFLIPGATLNPTILVTYKGASLPISPGADSADGVFKFLAKVPSGSDAYYLYRVQ
jgi:hypothetical protein